MGRTPKSWTFTGFSTIKTVQPLVIFYGNLQLVYLFNYGKMAGLVAPSTTKLVAFDYPKAKKPPQNHPRLTGRTSKDLE